MAEKPLKSYPQSNGYSIYAGVLAEQPAMAISVADAISTWAQVDALLADIAANLMRATEHSFRAAYAAVQNENARMQMIDAIILQSLSGKDCELAQKIMETVKKVGKKRNKFAHHMWAKISNVPNVIGLIDPRAKALTDLIDQRTELTEIIRLQDQKYIRVYTLQDIVDVANEVRILHNNLFQYYFYIDYPECPVRDDMRQRLYLQYSVL